MKGLKAHGTIFEAEGQKAIKETPEGTIATFVASTSAVDRDGEVIDPQGWIIPDGNINVLLDHEYKIRSVVGQIVGHRAAGEHFLLDVRFADKVAVNNMARFVVGMLHAGFLGPVSVGFMPHEWQEPDGKVYTRDSPSGYYGTNPGRKYLKQELLELSMVAVGSNRGAMLACLRSFELDPDLGPEESGPTPATSPTSVKSDVSPAPTPASPDPVTNAPHDELTHLFHPGPTDEAGANPSRAEKDGENAGEGDWLSRLLRSDERVTS